ADDHAGLPQQSAPWQVVDDLADQHLGGVEVRDYTGFQRADDLDVLGGPAKHSLGPMAHGDDRLVPTIDRDDGGLRHDDPASPDVDEHVGRSQIDADVVHEPFR